MNRRLISIVTATGVALGLVPLLAAPAHAAIPATAEITAGAVGYPGERNYSIRVSNGATNPLLDKAINAVRINLPVSAAGVALKSGHTYTQAGWTVTATNLGSTQYLTYRGGAIAPASNATLSFPASVARPASSDRTGDFRVSVSTDNFQTNQDPAAAASAGALDTKVQVLEILNGSLKPVLPTNGDNTRGVTDRSGTAGQTVTYAFQVKNHARDSVSVTGKLTSSSAADLVSSAPETVVVAGNDGVGAFRPTVVLGAATADRSATLQAEATSASATAPSGSAVPGTTSIFTIHAPVGFGVATPDVTALKSGPGSARTINVSVSKTGTQGLTLSTATLSFAGNTATAAGLPKEVPGGGNTVQLSFSFPQITGVDGLHPATLTLGGTDYNLASVSSTVSAGNIRIDNDIPAVTLKVELPEDVDGHQQIAVKDNDEIAVSGTATGTGDLVANSLKVVFQPNIGSAVTVPVTSAASADGKTLTYSGSAKVDWAEGATSFTAKAEISDTATNVGSVQTPGQFVIDNVLPKLNEPGEVITVSTIALTWSDSTGIRGGCDPEAYTVAGVPGAVESVLFSDGTACAADVLTTDGVRVLKLRNPLDQDATPRVGYSVLPRVGENVPVKDGAANDSVSATVNTINNVVPQAPSITTVRRKDSASTTGAYEPAYLDEGEKRYYTNVGGADAIEITVTNVRTGYTIVVQDDDGTTVASKKVTAEMAPLQSYVSDTVTFPLGTTESLYGRTVFLVNGFGNAGPDKDLAFQLDLTRPVIGTASASEGFATVNFSEKVVRGTTYADDWFVSEPEQTEAGTTNRTVGASSATKESDSVVKLGLANLLSPGSFTRSDYYLQSGNGVRYEDRAGNTMLNTLIPVV